MSSIPVIFVFNIIWYDLPLRSELEGIALRAITALFSRTAAANLNCAESAVILILVMVSTLCNSTSDARITICLIHTVKTSFF